MSIPPDSAVTLIITDNPQTWISDKYVKLESKTILDELNFLGGKDILYYYIVNPSRKDIKKMKKLIMEGKTCNSYCIIIMQNIKYLYNLDTKTKCQIDYIINDKYNTSLHKFFPELTGGKTILNDHTGVKLPMDR